MLFEYIIECEHHFKSLVAYYYSESYQEQKYPYLYTENYNSKDILKVSNLTASLSKIIKNKINESTPNSIKHYINQHQDVPLWVLCNYMTLEQTLLFYKLMTPSDQNKIAKEIGKLTNENLNSKTVILRPKHVISFMSNILETRNLVVHNNRVLDYKCSRNTPYIKELHTVYEIQPKEGRQDIFNVFVVMRCFLTKNQFAKLHNILRKRVRKLKNELNTISYNEVLSSLGFPEDWHDISTLSQNNE
ncbi:Abi family protein [Breznakia pachnodae]|nr:Abi family protein [Breznakia pachnodae]